MTSATVLSGPLAGPVLAVYQQDPKAVGGSLGWSALVSVVPLAVVLVALGALRVRAQWAALAGLVASLVVAIVGFAMPVGMALLAAAHGAFFGLFPIMWIVVNALWVFNMTVATGHFDVLRRSFGALSSDRRTQAILVAFCFGALLEALAGFGAPVAISAVMLVALGFRPLRAAVLALVANTAPVAFGAMGVPVITLAQVSGLPLGDVASMVGRQTPFLALFVPLVLVFLVDGRRGVREAWVPAVVAGVVFAIVQFATSNYVSVPLTDILAALLSAVAVVVVARAMPHAVWAARRPGGEPEAEPGPDGGSLVGAGGPDSSGEGTGGSGRGGDPRPTGGPVPAGTSPEGAEAVATVRSGARVDDPREIRRAYAPYVIIVLVFAIVQLPGIKPGVDKLKLAFHWPGLDVVAMNGKASSTTQYSLTWLSTAGTLMLIAGVIVAAVLGIGAAEAVRIWGRTVADLKWAILTVAAVLALAYVMNASAQTTAIGLLIAGAGGALAFLSPLLGWFGVAVTGSDTSSNALFGSLQVTAANTAGLPPELLAGANSSGGVLGKMLSPQNLTIAVAAVKLDGQEGVLLRKVVGWSLGMLLVLAILIYLQSTPVLGWMLP
ncbi:L-lactate permease [Pseudonocardia kujensis]|uniref:L-lactate permease n=1 Tax=Pseudonocardia kujensis TaxID=1128675 RepID=UPI001E5065E7|nr:L-lactate permease [Pseudonocardia kujensis]MCE0763903.1 L-lactate permease [Pseudonocardia kujensis]